MKIHSTAIVDPTAKIATDVAIGPYAVIGARVVIGERSTIESHVVIDPDVTIGSDNVRLDCRPFTDDDARSDHCVGPDRDISRDFRGWIDNRGRMNFHSTPASLKLK